jgi:diguanylate cyclase
MRELTAPEATPPAASAPAASGALVHADTLALLFEQSFPALYQSLIIASILCWTLWGQVEPARLLTWLGVLAASALIRLGMYLLYFRLKPVGHAIFAWERPYAATLVLSSLIWGVGVLWIMPTGNEVAQYVILFFVVGMVGGSLVSYSAHRGMTITAMLGVLLPITLWLFFQPGQIALGLAVASTLFMAGALRGTRVLNSAMQGNLLLGHELKMANRIADHIARTDELTGINNRRAFMELGEQTTRLCQRQRQPLSALLLDVDHFKQINDTYGHSAGDLVLKQIGSLMAQQFRAADVCGRIGGEEFAVLLADTDTQAATSVANKFRQEVANATLQWQGHTLQVTVSIGVASHNADLSTLLQRADAAMYQAKNSGRNRVVCQEEVA